MGDDDTMSQGRPPATASPAATAIHELIVYHGTEHGGFDKPRPGSFFTVSRAEAEAYCEITDTNADRSLRYVPVAAVRDRFAVPQKVDWNQSWPDYFDYVGPPDTIAVNGNTNRLFFWDGGTNAVGDKNMVILSGVLANDAGEVIEGATVDDEAITPRELTRRLFVCRLAIFNPIHLPWDEANILGHRLGAEPAKVNAAIAAWLAAGYDGIETLSDDGLMRGGRKIRQFIPFASDQITILRIDELSSKLANDEPLPTAAGKCSQTAKH